MSTITYTPSQERALELVRKTHKMRGVCVISGAAGSGKTTLVTEIIRLFRAGHHVPALVAPTGRAARRMHAVTGWPAFTIHSLFYKAVHRPPEPLRFERRTALELQAVIGGLPIIVDEASMVGQQLYTDVLEAARECGVGVVFIGDDFQLPPVDFERSGFSVFNSPHPRVNLEEVHRQAADSPLLACATKLRTAKWADCRKLLLDHLNLVPPGSSISDLVVSLRVMSQLGEEKSATICHRNNTRRALNRKIREKLGLDEHQLNRGEPLLVKKNNWNVGVCNGEIIPFGGWIGPPVHQGRTGIALRRTSITASDGKEVEVSACPEAIMGDREINPDRDIWHGWLAKADFGVGFLHAELGYTLTAHSAQGSEWDAGIVVIEPSLRALPDNEKLRWIYTAITRFRAGCDVAFLEF